MLNNFSRSERLLSLNCLLLVAVIGLLCVVLVRVSSSPKPPVDLVKAWKVTNVELDLDRRVDLQEGDLIIGVDGKKVWSAEALRSALPGTLLVLRGEKAERFYIEISGKELGAKIEPRSVFMLKEAAPL